MRSLPLSLLLATSVLLAAPLSLHARPSASIPGSPVDTASAEVRGPTDLKPGQFLWHPEISPSGPIVLVVSLDEQRAYVYRNGIAIGLSTISSGKAGHETPTGVFTILQKDKDHRSNLYNSAPMPYMQRLTWDGIALHGGALPGHPASHGCVRLPQAFAQKLFGATQRGDTVVVADAKSSPMTLAYPSVLAPVTSRGQALPEVPASDPAAAYWNEDAAPAGQVGVLVSLHDQRVYVLRDGVLIGESPLAAAALPAFQGTTLFVMGEGYTDIPSPLDSHQRLHRWTAYPLLGQAETQATPDLLATPSLPMALPEEFARHLYAALVPGTTLLVTMLPAVRPSAAEPGLQPVLESEPDGSTL
ncbi:L,D-transpeptidase [Stenotrophomonas tumulicola]|uniref:L,D-transpeptidase n=1 Tax=Stenotrophomonas tumulicola TaxID=1685415 RepID=A0A7W3FM86_9GAMM|nr:L,D-transpeptidase [Stenotrophomonas tumulicola]MBA8681841.1 L,D-transpeptidase [Stenotrophomonas tumulicola]